MNVCENKSNLVARMDVTPAYSSFNILPVGYFFGKVQQKVVFQMVYAQTVKYCGKWRREVW